MPGSSSVLDKLQEQLKDGVAAVEEATTKAGEAQVRLSQAKAAQSALQRAIGEARTATTSTDRALAAATDPAATATRASTDLATALNVLSGKQRSDVDSAIKEVDDRHTTLEDERKKAEDALQKATGLAEAATRDSATAEKGLADALAAIRTRGTVVQGLAASVTALSTRARAAFDANRLGMAYRLNQELALALKKLEVETGQARTDELQAAVETAWKAVDEKRRAAAASEEVVAQRQADRDAAVKKLAEHDAGRVADLDAKILRLEQTWALTPPEPPAGPDDGGG